MDDGAYTPTGISAVVGMTHHDPDNRDKAYVEPTQYDNGILTEEVFAEHLRKAMEEHQWSGVKGVTNSNDKDYRIRMNCSLACCM